jgi:hypothetical protein
MAQDKGGWLEKLRHRRSVRHWGKIAQRAPSSDLADLRKRGAEARQLRSALDTVVTVADARLGLPVIGSNAFPLPHGVDWSWRPDLWRQPLTTPGMASVQSKSRLGGEVTMFHDCAVSEVTLRQLRNTREQDLAPYGLRMDVFRFDGSFLSLVLDLPAPAAQGLHKNHLIRLDTIVELEKPLEVFARLNVKHGPNTEQVVRELPLNQQDRMVEFDLSYTKMIEKRVEKLWVDLIFENPEMNQVTLRDVTFSRRPRAEF